MRNLRNYRTIKGYNADVDAGRLIEGKPYISYLRSDLKSGDVVKFGIEKVESLTMWIDDYPSESEFYQERYGYSSFDEYLDDYIDDPGSFDSNCFTYINETVEYDGVTYYAWEHDNGEDFYLTNTIDLNTLYNLSMEANRRNRNCPAYAYLYPDLEGEPYIKNYDDTFHVLVKVENVNGTLQMWVDDFPTLFTDFFGLWDENILNYEDYFEYLFDNGPDYNGANEYRFDGETVTYHGNTYYLWEHQDTGEGDCVRYALTRTVNFQELYNMSIENDSSNRNCPIYAFLADDKSEYSEPGCDDENYVLLKVEKNQ